MKKHKELIMALVLLVSILGGVYLAAYMFGFKLVLTWMLMSIGTLLCGIAATLATHLIENERLQRVTAGFIEVAIPVVIGIGTVGLARSEDAFIFALCILQSSVYVLIFVCVASAISCLFDVFKK